MASTGEAPINFPDVDFLGVADDKLILLVPSATDPAVLVPATNCDPDICAIQGCKLTCNDKAFENTSTSVAASQMRNALNNLADTVTDKEEKKVCDIDAINLTQLIDYNSSLRPRWTTSSLCSGDT